jgi:hypothetical protein
MARPIAALYYFDLSERSVEGATLGVCVRYDANPRGATTMRIRLGIWVATGLCAAVLLLFSTPAYVHHSGAMFDLTREVTIKGTVTEFNWTNPHTSFKVSVPNPDGTQSIWGVEMNSPNNLVRAGWKRTTIKPGDKVTVKVRPLRDGAPGGQYISIILPDGKSLGGEQKR